MPPFSEIEKHIREAMLADRFRLRRQLRGIQNAAKAGKPYDRMLGQLRQKLDRSLELAEKRRRGLPAVKYDEDLPVAARREEIADAIRNHQVVVVCGETGSGKSTQLPKICLELGRGVLGMIGHTQPRRIAARSIATRVAEEIGTPLGKKVGYKIRFADETGPGTYVKLMTDGILLAETQGDRFLEQYDTIIVDEAHERSLNIDFLIGYLKRLLAKRRDLKVIITSATIDAERFARHFPERGADGSRVDAPVIEVSGRTYPVDVYYRPLISEDGEEEADWLDAVVEAVDELARLGQGNMLIFMPTERDIHETAKALRGHPIPGDTPRHQTEVLPLYARLPAKQQQRIFAPSGRRRIVIATNVAESSLTVPGIHYVIDPGTARISRYSARTKTQRLPIEPISRASADQRKGRCGRIGPGICVRLYGEADFDSRDRYTQPEILRSNLASVILQAKALRLGDLERFPFLEPPRPTTIRDGYKTLFELGAIDEKQELTPLGRQLGRLPVDPRIGRMILAGDEWNCLAELLIIAAGLEVRDPRERPTDKQEAADAAHAKFVDENSDFLGYLELWDFYQHQRHNLSRNQLRKACRQNFLSYNRMREWSDVHHQLLELASQAGLKVHKRKDEYNAIHCAILTGLLSNIAFKSAKFEYSGGGGTKFHLWPGSTVFRKNPTWVVSAELVETTKRYLRTCAKINADWIEPIAEHLVKRTYSEPHWDGKNGSAMAFERVSLFGLIVVPRRRISLSKLDPETARELLIRDGLVGGDVTARLDFLEHNQALAKELERLQKKLRQHDMLQGEWAQFEFYDQRLPEHIVDIARLRKWLKDRRKGKERTRRLCMSREDLLRDETAKVDAAAFPDEVSAGGLQLPLDYQYEPGAENDGVHVVVPLEGLNQIEEDLLDWLVPGMLEEKIVALIKSLPKSLRRQLIPAPDTAKAILGQLDFGKGSLLQSLAIQLSRRAGERISSRDFQIDRIPQLLQMNVRVVDSEGNTVASGRELTEVRKQVGHQTAESLSAVDDSDWNRDGLQAWDFDELPKQVDVRRGDLVLRGFPMLVDRGDSVDLRLTDSLDRAERESRHGVVRLLSLTIRREIRSQISWFPAMEQMALHAASIADFKLKEQVAALIAIRAFELDRPIPRTREEFEQRIEEGRRRVGLAVQDVSELLPPVMKAYHEARLALEETTAGRWQYALDDMRAQLGRLIYPDFLTRTPWAWLQQYSRFFRAMKLRLDALRGGSLRRDQFGCEEVQALWHAYESRANEAVDMNLVDPELDHIRWMIEEYRVSLFAQKLGTSIPISAKRIAKQWAKVSV